MYGKFLGLFLALIFISACYPDTARAGGAVTAGLIAYWPLDEATIEDNVVEDAVGNSHGEM